VACLVRFRSARDGAALRAVAVPRGTTLLDAVRRAGLPLARACRAEGLCGRCGLRVLAGAETLAPPSPRVARGARNRVPSDFASHIGEARGPLEVTAASW
jgi:ferredoxin